MGSVDQGEILGSGGYTYLIVFWYTMQVLGGHILLPALAATFVFTSAKRHVALVNLCVTFIFTSVVSCLLLYTNSFNGPEPNRTLCLFQAASTDALPPMCATALAALCWHIWSGEVPNSKYATTRKVTIIAAPYVVYIGGLIAGLMVAALNPGLVTRLHRHIYCHIDDNTLGIVSGGYAAVVILIGVVLTIHRCFCLWRSHRYLKARHVVNTAPPELCLIIRLAVFVVYSSVGLIFSLWTAVSQPNPSLRDMYVATLPLVISLAFGTQRDVLRAWCFWRHREQKSPLSPTFAACHTSQNLSSRTSQNFGSPVESHPPFVVSLHRDPSLKTLPSIPEVEKV